MDEGTIKTQNPKCRLVLKRVYRLHGDTVSRVGIFDFSCELLPLYLLSYLPIPLPLPKVNVCRHCVAVGGGGVLSCVVDHILQEFNTLFLTRFKTYKIATPPQTKIQVKTTFRDWCLYSSFIHVLVPWNKN